MLCDLEIKLDLLIFNWRIPFHGEGTGFLGVGQRLCLSW